MPPHPPHNSLQSLQRKRRRASVLAIGAVAAGLLLTAPYWLPLVGAWLAIPSRAGQSDVIAVSGGTVARTAHGVALYHRQLAPQLWHTGYARGRPWLSADVFARGVPEDHFRYLSTTSTWSDGEEIAAAVQSHGLRRVLLVTDWWHSRRALCSLRAHIHQEDVAVLVATAPVPVGPERWWRDEETRGHVLRELAKIGYYVVRYGMRPWGCQQDTSAL